MSLATRMREHSPAAGGGAPTTLSADTFTRANGSLAGSTTETGGQTWTRVGSTGSWDISSDAAIYSPGASVQRIQVDAGQADVTASVDLTIPSTCVAALVFRSTAASLANSDFHNDDAWLLIYGWTANTLELRKLIDSDYSTIAGSYSVTLSAASTHTFSVVLSGTSIDAHLDGTSRISLTDSYQSTATSFGLFVHSSFDTGTKFDNFLVTQP